MSAEPHLTRPEEGKVLGIFMGRNGPEGFASDDRYCAADYRPLRFVLHGTLAGIR